MDCRERVIDVTVVDSSVVVRNREAHPKKMVENDLVLKKTSMNVFAFQLNLYQNIKRQDKRLCRIHTCKPGMFYLVRLGFVFGSLIHRVYFYVVYLIFYYDTLST